MYGLLHPDIDIVGVVTGYGNVTQEKATSNAAYLLQLAGREDIPVINGAKSLYLEILQHTIQKFMGGRFRTNSTAKKSFSKYKSLFVSF